MVTEVLIWALILTERPKVAVEIYNNELLCRQDAKEVRKALPDHPVTCVPRRSTGRPQGGGTL
jgi:hypothetical protein